MKTTNNSWPYVRLVKWLRQSCKALKWHFKLDRDLQKTLDEGIAFNIDGIGYFVQLSNTPPKIGFYAATIVQNHGNREEPPSEDELPIIKDGDIVKYQHAESLIMPIIDWHWKIRRGWVGESLQDSQAEEFEWEERPEV